MSEATASGALAPNPIAQSDPSKAPAPQAAPDYRGTKHRVPVGGKEVEVDYEEMRRGYTHGKAANQKFQEAKKLADQASAIIARADSPQDAVKLLVERHGPEKARMLFENYLLEQMDYEQLPEAEKRARALEQKLKAMEAEKEEGEKSRKQREFEEISSRAHDDLNNDISEALKGLGRKPTPYLVARIADEMAARLVAKGEAIPAAKAAELATAGIKADIAEYLTGMSAEEAYKLLPKAFLDNLRQHEVSRVQDARQQRRPKQSLNPSEPKERPKKVFNTDDWFARKMQKLAR